MIEFLPTYYPILFFSRVRTCNRLGRQLSASNSEIKLFIYSHNRAHFPPKKKKEKRAHCRNLI